MRQLGTGAEPAAETAAAHSGHDSSTRVYLGVIRNDVRTQGGGRAVIHTGDLSAGTHTLTATATDSDNMSASASATIIVKESNDPPAAVADTGYTRAGRAVVVDVVANDTDAEGDIDPNSVRVVVAAALGAAAVSEGAAGAVIGYISASHGIDTLIYEVCDTARQCSLAELTIIAGADS